MIVTVTMNPSIDKTLFVNNFKQGTTNRVESSTLTPGGKGINVSIVLKQAGEPNIAVALFGGSNGIAISGKLAIKGIRTEQIMVPGESRTNIKVISGTELTEINEPGPELKEKDIGQLFTIMDKYARSGNIFVFSGSIPRGIGSDIYKRLIERVKAKGSIAILDTYGDALREGMKAVPYAIKPNIHELYEYKNIDTDGKLPEDFREFVEKCAEEFLAAGVRLVCISMGREGAYFTDGKNKQFCSSEVSDEEIKSAAGAGDSMVAAMAYALSHSLSFEKMTDLAMKSAAVACTDIGL